MIFITKWLPIVFGCHCRADRSFFYQGKQLPICARCTGELIGIIVAPLLMIFWSFPIYIYFILLCPLVLDGGLQLVTKYTSKNWLRCVTGILFGYALAMIFVVVTVKVYSLGYHFGAKTKIAWLSRFFNLFN